MAGAVSYLKWLSLGSLWYGLLLCFFSQASLVMVALPVTEWYWDKRFQTLIYPWLPPLEILLPTVPPTALYAPWPWPHLGWVEAVSGMQMSLMHGHFGKRDLWHGRNIGLNSKFPLQHEYVAPDEEGVEWLLPQGWRYRAVYLALCCSSVHDLLWRSAEFRTGSEDGHRTAHSNGSWPQISLYTTT